MRRLRSNLFAMKLIAVELSCRASQLISCLRLFTEHLGYSLVGNSRKSGAHVLQLRNTWFIVKPSEEQECVEYISNLVFCVEDLARLYTCAKDNGAEVVEALTSFHCECGECSVFSVRSPFPSVNHTFTDCPAYAVHHIAAAEPNSSSCLNDSDRTDTDWKSLLSRDIDCIDHVAFVCRQGESKEHVSWYQQVLGFKRFYVNSSETNDGFTINCDSNGMRMLTMEYYRCAEVCVSLEEVKLVFGEALPGPGPNQIENFLKENGGPGVQHVAYHSRNIFSTTTLLRNHGQAFLQPPREYYSQIGKLAEIPWVGHSEADLLSLGILLDREEEEEEGEGEEEDGKSKERGCSYLMQVFTKNLFNAETFFLEYIQRNGATGFGAGNIVALWKAVQAHLDAQRQSS